jgi:hypothetical protein
MGSYLPRYSIKMNFRSINDTEQIYVRHRGDLHDTVRLLYVVLKGKSSKNIS